MGLRRKQESPAQVVAEDEKLRGSLARAAGAAAQIYARARLGGGKKTVAEKETSRTVGRFAYELAEAARRLAQRREQPQRRRLRRAVVAAGVAGAGWVAARRLSGGAGGVGSAAPLTVTESMDVEVPPSRAYNQWTQFERFPDFMGGVEEVRQLDDTRLHWVARVAGRRREWDAKITEQEPDRRVAWVSETAPRNGGVVTFRDISPSVTRITVEMEHEPANAIDRAAGMAGLDARRVRADLARFKALIESQGTETGAWRGEVHQGEPTASPPPPQEPLS